jgi:hypothetical protein
VFGNGPDWSGCLIAAAVGLLGALNKGIPTARRPVTEKIAERFAAHYINSEQAAGRSPTIRGLAAAAKSADMHTVVAFSG